MNPYTIHINLYDLLFVGTIFIGLTFAALLLFTKKTDQTANRFLALALFAAVLWISRLLSIDIGLSAYIANWSWLPLQFSLVLGPLIFFYVLKLTRPEYKFRAKDLLHFSPLLLELGAQALEVKESLNTGAATYHTQIFHRLNPVLQVLTVVSVAIYLYRCYKLIETFYQQQKFINGDRYRHELRWLRILLSGLGALWLLWIPLTAVGYYHYHFGVHAYHLLYLLSMSMLIWIAARTHLRPDVGVQAYSAPVLKSLLPAELKQKGTWLKKAMKVNQYYQDPELSLNSLSEKLDLHTHELSRIINTVLKKSFNDFVNEYRVTDVVRKMQDPAYDHITLLGIAYESGFNSQSTFNRIFKHMTGKSPADYKNEQKKRAVNL